MFLAYISKSITSQRMDNHIAQYFFRCLMNDNQFGHQNGRCLLICFCGHSFNLVI